VDSRDLNRARAQRDDLKRGRIRTPGDESGAAPHFKLIFTTVVALTVLALLLNVLLAVFGSDSDQVKAAAETCSTTHKMGFGAIVGLIGGKAL
jgi:hypothetical protein